MPKGDPTKGKTVFEKFECYYCHEVRGEQFPSPTEDAPELSQMGAMHPVEFFAESIMNPNAVVPKAYRQSDGKSPMTDFTAKMTVQELIDVSAYVASLRPKGAPKTVSGRGKVIALVPETWRNRFGPRGNKRIHGCDDHGLQSQPAISIKNCEAWGHRAIHDRHRKTCDHKDHQISDPSRK